MASSCSPQQSSSSSSLSTVGSSSSLNLARLAINDEDADAPSYTTKRILSRNPSTPSFRYSPTVLLQSHQKWSMHQTKRDHHRVYDVEESHGSVSSGTDCFPHRESKLHRRTGWGSADSRRAYRNLSVLAAHDTTRQALQMASSDAAANFASDVDDGLYSFDADDWGYFVDTR